MDDTEDLRGMAARLPSFSSDTNWPSKLRDDDGWSELRFDADDRTDNRAERLSASASDRRGRSRCVANFRTGGA
jgi:hypothetical protein